MRSYYPDFWRHLAVNLYSITKSNSDFIEDIETEVPIQSYL